MLTVAKIKVAVTMIVTATAVTVGSVVADQSVAPDDDSKLAKPPKAATTEKDGLSLSITPAKRELAADELPAFRVVWKNTSDKPYMLFDADYYKYVGPWRIVARNLDTGENWLVGQRGKQQRAVTPSRRLEPGAQFAFDFVMDDNAFSFTALGSAENVVGPIDQSHLPRGRYEFTFAITLTKNHFATKENPFRVGPYELPHWTGHIVSTPVRLTVLPPKDFSMIVTPAKSEIAEDEPLAFRVEWKNMSDKPFLLFDVDFHVYWRKIDYRKTITTERPVTVIAYDIDTGRTWWAMLSRNVDDGTPAQSRQLDAGAKYAFDVATPEHVHFLSFGELRGWPVRHEFVGGKSEKHLPPGRYKITFTARFRENRFATEKENFAVGPYELRHWTGKIVSAPVRVNVKAAK